MFTTLLRNITLALLIALSAHAAHAGEQLADNRIKLVMTATERAEFLAEMRKMLGSVQAIMQGIGDANREQIAAAARLSGNKMARATPDKVRNRLPPAFKEMGGPTHMMFEELAIRAETDEMDMLALETAKLMQQCMACHETYRVH
jgi:cytochrome c556